MDTHLETELYEKYPYLFSNKDLGPRQSCMAFGIECGNGWYEILSSVCFIITQHEKNIEARNKYFYKEDRESEVVIYQQVKFDQIKEKFGGLRIYYSGGDDYISGVIKMADEMSYNICEVCGNKGKPNKDGWIKPLCENCKGKTNG